MWAESIMKRRILVSYSHGEVGQLPLPSRFRPKTSLAQAIRAFADGFVSSLIGGLVYCLILLFYYPSELGLGWFRVLVLCATFGCIEMWRVTRRRTFRDMKAGLLWAFTANLVMWWVLGVSMTIPPNGPSTGPSLNHGGPGAGKNG